jgi:hypothetical protein
VRKPFFAKYDPNATWLDHLVPAFGKPKFFFETDEPDHGHAPMGRVIPLTVAARPEAQPCASRSDAA